MDARAVAERLRRAKWRPRYCATLHNVTAPGGAVDLYALEDEDGILHASVSVPEGMAAVVLYIASACQNPWFMNVNEETGTALAVEFNRAIERGLGKDRMVDARDVFIAAGTMFTSYGTALPMWARRELIPAAIAQLQQLLIDGSNDDGNGNSKNGDG